MIITQEQQPAAKTECSLINHTKDRKSCFVPIVQIKFMPGTIKEVMLGKLRWRKKASWQYRVL